MIQNIVLVAYQYFAYAKPNQYSGSLGTKSTYVIARAEQNKVLLEHE